MQSSNARVASMWGWGTGGRAGTPGMHRGWSIGMVRAASACWSFPWRMGTWAPPPRAVRVVVLLLLLLLVVVSMAVPVVGTVTIVAATSMIVTSWEVAPPSAPVLKGPPVATETTVIPTIALVISGRIVPLPAVWTGSWSRAKRHERWKIKRTDRGIQEDQREKECSFDSWTLDGATESIFTQMALPVNFCNGC